MKIIRKLFNLFSKTKTVKNKIENFIELHNGNIKVLMNILQVMYDKTAGKAKMQQCISFVLNAIGIAKRTTEVLTYTEEKLQKIYDDLKANGCLK